MNIILFDLLLLCYISYCRKPWTYTSKYGCVYMKTKSFKSNMLRRLRICYVFRFA